MYIYVYIYIYIYIYIPLKEASYSRGLSNRTQRNPSVTPL